MYPPPPFKKRQSAEPMVIGASGLVGGASLAALWNAGYEAYGTFRTHRRPGLWRYDLSSSPDGLFMEFDMHLVVLASALTNVDYCESHPEEARQQNVTEVARLVKWCRQNSRPLVYFSTDYVFDGQNGPYAENEPSNPLNVYGRTKLEAEALVLSLDSSVVIRITNVFDIGFEDRNFVHRCVTHLRDRLPLIVPADQFATPTYATWLADQWVTLLKGGAILERESPRILNAGCDEVVSRGELARRIAARLGADASLIEERPTAELNQAAARPLRGGLRNDLWKRLLGVERLSLDDALDDCLPRMLALYESRP